MQLQSESEEEELPPPPILSTQGGEQTGAMEISPATFKVAVLTLLIGDTRRYLTQQEDGNDAGNNMSVLVPRVCQSLS